METESILGLAGAKGGGGEEWEVIAKRYRISSRSDGSVLKFGGGDGCTTLGIYQKSLNCTL